MNKYDAFTSLKLNGNFRLEEFSRFISKNDQAKESFLRAYDCKNINGLDLESRDFFLDVLKSALSINSENTKQFTPDEASETLSLIRLGQPTPKLMKIMSSEVSKSLEHLFVKLKSKDTVVKTIVGEPGAGKTTYKNLLEAELLSVDCVIVDLVMSANPRMSLRQLILALLFDKSIINSALDKLVLIYNNEDDLKLVKKRISKMNYGFIMDYFLCAAEVIIKERMDHDSVVTKLREGLHKWLTQSIKGDLYEISSLCAGYRSSIPESPKEVAFAEITKETLIFFKSIDLSVVWLIDEFEAIANLQANQLSIALNYFRDIIDYTLSIKKFGSGIFLFATESGYNIIKTNGALSSRLEGPERFFLNNPRWSVSEFSAWEPSSVIDVILQLYAASSEIDGNKAELNYNKNKDLINLFISDQLDSDDTARIKLKRLVVDIFDLLSQDEYKVVSFIEKLDEIRNSQQKESNALPFVEVDKRYDTSSALSNVVEEITTRPEFYEPDSYNEFIDNKLPIPNIDHLDIKQFDDKDIYKDDLFQGVEDEENILDIDDVLSDEDAFLENSPIEEHGFIEKPYGFEKLYFDMVQEENVSSSFIGRMLQRARSKDAKLIEININEIDKKLIVEGELIRFVEPDILSTLQDVRKKLFGSKIKSYVYLAKKYSRYRDMGGISADIPNLQEISIFLARHRSDLSNQFILSNLRDIIDKSSDGYFIPVQFEIKSLNGRDKSKIGISKSDTGLVKFVRFVDLGHSLSVLRTFVYTYLFAHGIHLLDQNDVLPRKY